MAGVIILDACVLIAHLDRSDDHHERADRLLLDLADHELGASTLTLAEVFVGPARSGRLHVAASAVRALGVRDIAPGPDAAARLAEFRAQTGLKLPDCCVLLAAEDEGAPGIGTFDEGLGRTAKGLGLDVAPA